MALRLTFHLARRFPTHLQSEPEEKYMPDKAQKIGWIGPGRMGFPMAERLLKAGYDVSIWNRTRAKAEPLTKSGGKIVDRPSDLAGVDVLFAVVSTGKDLEQVYRSE